MFEWDGQKNKLNQAKHGLAFEEAMEIWSGVVFVREDTRSEYGEPRWLALGKLSQHGTIMVAYTMRGEDIRIISARPANRTEREVYHAYLKEAH